MEVGENVHDDVLIWNLMVIKVESPDHFNNMEQQGEDNCAFAKLMSGQKQVQWISYKYLGTLI